MPACSEPFPWTLDPELGHLQHTFCCSRASVKGMVVRLQVGPSSIFGLSNVILVKENFRPDHHLILGKEARDSW